MKKSRILLGLSLVGLLTGCGTPQQNENNNNSQQQVVNGKDGIGIKSITLTGTEGNVDIYTITYTDNTTSIFKVTNGKDGAQGIQGEPGKDGITPTISIGENGNWIINGEDTGINASGSKGDKGDTGERGPQGDKGDTGEQGPKGDKGDTGEQGPQGEKGDKGETGEQGPQGEKGDKGDTGDQGPQGETGNGIEKIELTDSIGNIDTYTIYFTDGTTTTFEITNGTDGSQGASGEDGKSAFEIYKEFYPEYQGTEEEWINAVIKGEFNKFKVTFDANGGELLEEKQIEVKKGLAIGEALPVPVKEGKEFLGRFTGWSANDVQITVNTPIYADLNLVAKWDTYDVDFMNFDGSVFESFDVKHGEVTSEPENEPTKPTDENHSYYFDHWGFDFSQKIYSDIEIYPVWDEKEPVFTIEFGSYPQSVVSDETLKADLSSLENGTISGTVLEYDSDGDKIAEKYLCKETQKQVKADDGTKIEVGINYFRFEPIEWRILSQDSACYSVVSDRVLDAQYWNRNESIYEDPETFIKETVTNNYELSEIRKRLNEDFLNVAFTDEERNKIKTTFVDNSVDSTLSEKNKYVCDNTNDKIYLLSRKEAVSYPFSFDVDGFDKNKITKATDYAKALGVEGMSSTSETYGDCSWWLRSPLESVSLGGGEVWYVRNDGYIGFDGVNTRTSRYGVRPAMVVTI